MSDDVQIDAGKGVVIRFLDFLLLFYPLVVIIYSYFVWDAINRFAAIFLGGSLCITIINIISKKPLYKTRQKTAEIIISVLVLLSLVSMTYFYIEYTDLMLERTLSEYMPDLIMAVIAIALVLYFTYAAMGATIFGLIVISLLYAYFGSSLFGVLRHPGIEITGILQYGALEFSGIFGTITQVISTWVAVFIIWASLVLGFYGRELIFKGSIAICRTYEFMLVEIAVLASMILGMFSGSAAGNAAGTGSFTIPLMKRFGVPAKTAAAIEAVSSSAGQVMPPIMGAAAFIMADFLGKYYFEIVKIAFFPAFIFYICLAFAVYFATSRFIKIDQADQEHPFGIEGTENGNTYQPGMIDIVPIAVSFIVLIYLMGFLQMSILSAGFMTIVSFLLPRLIIDLKTCAWKLEGVRRFLKGVEKGLKDASNILAPIGVLGAGLGLVVSTLSVTGLGPKLSTIMVDVAGNNLVLLMVLVMIVSIIFGMAVGTVATYILVIVLAAPALMQAGIEPVCSHFAVFYAAMLSAITPPVAVACVATSMIAGAPFFRVCWQSMKIGAPLFILPFVFMLKPDLLLLSSATPLVIIITLFGMMSVTMGLNLPLTGVTGNGKRFIYFLTGMVTLFSHSNIIVMLLMGFIIAAFIYEMLELKKNTKRFSP